jgi:DNA-binding NarL/FixJ family response regulator
VRIVIGEDSAVVREGLALLLIEAGHEIVARASDGPGVVEAVLEHRPDLLVTDIRMPPDMADDGARAAQRLREDIPELPVVLLSQHVETTLSTSLVSTGAFGYLLKDRVLDLDDFLDALRRVASGGSALDPEVVASLLAPTRSELERANLTEREREVLGLVAEGRSNSAVASRLFMTERTVETHVRHIFTKLGLYHSDDDHRRVLAVLAYLRSSS